MQLVLSNNRIIAHGENFLAMGGVVVNTETGARYENATVTECDGCPSDIGEVGYEYHAGVFVPCAPYGKTDDGTLMVSCNECATPKDSKIQIKDIAALVAGGVLQKYNPLVSVPVYTTLGFFVSNGKKLVFGYIPSNGKKVYTNASTDGGNTWNHTYAFGTDLPNISGNYYSYKVGNSVYNKHDDNFLTVGRMYHANAIPNYQPFLIKTYVNDKGNVYDQTFTPIGLEGGDYDYSVAVDDNGTIVVVPFYETPDAVIGSGVVPATIPCPVYLSTDGGTTWAEKGPIFAGKVCYGDGKFVVVGDRGRGSYSFDGTNWTTLETSAVLSTATNICYGNSYFLVTSGSNYAAYSEDGITWTSTQLPFEGSTGIAYGKGRFLVFYSSGSSNLAAYTTDCGSTWTASKTNGVFLNGRHVTYDHGNFLIHAAKVNYYGDLQQSGAIAVSYDKGESFPKVGYHLYSTDGTDITDMLAK